MTDLPKALETAHGQKSYAPVVCLVFCGSCRGERPLGKVLRTKAGLLFTARWTSKEIRDQARHREATLRAESGRRVNFLVGEGVDLLLDRSASEDQDWPPRVRCPRHGEAVVSVEELRAAIKAAAPAKATVVVHHNA